jgi:outer membrane protein OmpA-like peptidoglycan-associated protein
LAAKPEDILSKTQLDAEKVTHYWEPYLSLNHALVFSRTSHLLNPPETVSLQLEGEVLVARGSAPHQWIMDTRKLLRAIPGISQFQDKDLVDADIVAFNAIQESLKKRVFFFVLDSTALAPNQDNPPEEVVTEVQRLLDLSQIVGRGIRIEIVGHTDLSGTERRNKHLSQQRADEIRSFLAGKGIPPAILNAEGVGTSEPLREEMSMADTQFNRSVTFRVSSPEAGSGDTATR